MIQEFFAKRTDKEKKLINVTFLFVLVASFKVFFLGPIMDRLKSVDGEIDFQVTSINRDARFLKYRDKINKESEAFAPYMTARPRADGKKIEEDDIITEFFSRVEKLANQSNVNLVKSNPTEPKKEKDFTQYYANVDCTGSLKDAMTFMHAINASNEDLLKIVQFTMAPKKGAFSEVNVSMTITKLMINTETPVVATAPVATLTKKSLK